jgi:glycosyltransferase involved in cell wall biosynthesis
MARRPEHSLDILHFAPLPWAELQRHGYRKTAGAMFKALWGRADIAKLWYIQTDRRWGFRTRRQRIDEKVEVIGLPIGLPYERFGAIRLFNRFFQSLSLRHIISTGQRSHIYWYYDWLDFELIKHLPRAVTVMELTDSMEQFFSRQHQIRRRLPQIKQEALNLTDVVFPASPRLAEEIKSGHCAFSIEPNGIGSEFLRQSSEKHPEPEELHHVRRPRIVVVGSQWSLNNRVDHDLLAQVINRLPQWHIVLIGCEKIESDGLRNLAALDRVHILGMVSQVKLIPYIQHCDVCAVPYVWSLGGHCLKIYEYLACGKPVVVTEDGILESRPSFHEFVRKADTPESFAMFCEELGRSQRTSLIGKTHEILKQMTWDKRAERCIEFIRVYMDSNQK